MALGSPWTREALLGWWPRDSALALLRQALFVPTWQPAPGPYPYTPQFTWTTNLGFVLLLVTVAVLVPRLVARPTAAGGVRWAAAVGAGVLVSVLGSALQWILAIAFGTDVILTYGRDASALLGSFLVDGLVFGVLFGLLIAVVYAGGATAPPQARARAASRTRQRRTAMAGSFPEAPAPVATGTTPGDVTRYLCAAAYLRPSFARRVVDDVLGDGLGAIAVSPGVDLVPVARHSLTAHRLHRERNRKLAAVTCLIAAFGPLWLLFAGLALRTLGAAARGRPRAVRGREVPPVSRAAWRVAGTAGALLLAGVLAGMALSALPLPGLLRWLVGGYLLGLPPLLAVIAGGALALRIVADEDRDMEERLRGALRRDVFDPDMSPRPAPVEPWAAARIAAVAAAQRGNVTCYSGFSPFVGYGEKESEWTLSVPLLPPEPSREGGGGRESSAAVSRFDAWDVVTRLRRRLREVAEGTDSAAGSGRRLDENGRDDGWGGRRDDGWDGGRDDGWGDGGRSGARDRDRDGGWGDGGRSRARDGGRGDRAVGPATGDWPPVDGLVVEDRVFVSGRELARDGRLLPDPRRAPVTLLPAEALRRIALNPDGVARHCVAAHVPLWGGEVVSSHFLHVAVVGRTLHLRCDRYVLGPVWRDLHVVDLLRPAGAAGSRAALVLKALGRTGAALRGAARSFLADALAEYRTPRRRRREQRAAVEDPAFDRGARVSVREDAQGPEYLHHFQLVDARRALNALDRHALAAVRDFLDEHGVDTADFRTQSQTILNHGVLQTGGVSVVGNQAVGQGAQATAESATARAGDPPRSGTAAKR
ncbi:hypothetical protein ACFPM3_04835 [Streptomyces coeruleoprunus]|uniref:Uncharacterized protein n=1 Tax=Streptomyces coeruleoprunus TaxID=285563 RepID=A0ABV9XAI5_9ACTN